MGQMWKAKLGWLSLLKQLNIEKYVRKNVLYNEFQMPGFPVFGTGQPTLAGFQKCLEPIEKKYGDEKAIFWVNLRQEPVVYVNGKPYSARDPEK